MFNEIRKDQFKYFFNLFFIILLLSLAITLVSLVYSTGTFNLEFFKSQVLSLRVLFLNFLPVFIIVSLLTFITNRLWLGFFLSGLAFSVLSIANKNKIFYRDEPVKASDLEIISESINMAGKYDLIITWPMVLMVLSLIAITYLLKKKSIYKKIKFKTRVLSLILILILAIISSFSFFFDEGLYEQVGDKDLINVWSENQRFQSKGLTYPFFYSAKQLKDIKLDYYDEELAKEILNTYQYQNIDEGKKVHFISIMLEAYNDFSSFKEVELEKDVYKNFHKIQEESISGNLITNVFGGGTINTELGYLTSISMHPRYTRNTNSNVWYFKEQGYKTEGMHPMIGEFYNRINVYDRIGFDNFYHYDNNFKDISKDYLDDMEFFDHIIDGYEKSIKEDKPYFHFSVTLQNHGPYSDYKTEGAPVLKKKETYDEKTYNIINNYLKGIGKTDLALKKLIDYFEKENEPVVLVLFGDHNPWLGDEAKGFKMLGINMDFDSQEGFKNYYTTPYIFWGNDAAKAVLKKDFKGVGTEVSPMFLMPQLLDYIDYPGDEYMEFVKDMKKYISVNNPNFTKYKDQYFNKLEGEGLKKLQELNIVQFYRSRNFNR